MLCNCYIYESEDSQVISEQLDCADFSLQDLNDEQACKSHILSMLAHMAEQEEFLEMTNEEPGTYTDAKEYIEKNGISYYGLAVGTTKEDVLEIQEMEGIYAVCAIEELS